MRGINANGTVRPPLDGALDTHETNAEGVLSHFTDATDATIAEVIDVIHLAVAVADVDEHLSVENVRSFAVRRNQLLRVLVRTSSEVLVVVQNACARISLRPTRRLNFMRPTAERSYRSGLRTGCRTGFPRRPLSAARRTHHAIDLNSVRGASWSDQCAGCQKCMGRDRDRSCRAS